MTWTATDEAGNQTALIQLVTVEDKEAPIVLTQNLFFEILEGEIVTIVPEDVDGGSYDNCSSVSLSIDQNIFTDANEGENIVTLAGEDNVGNSSSGQALITIVVIREPSCRVFAIAKDITVYLDKNGSASVSTNQVNNGSYSECANGKLDLSLSKSIFDCADLGDSMITLTATDRDGNVGIVEFNVTVIDDIAPSIDKTPKFLRIRLGEGQTFNLPDYREVYSANDNCVLSSYIQQPASGMLIDQAGSYPINLIAIDANGNSIQSQFDLIVEISGSGGKGGGNGKGKGPNKSITSNSLLTVPWNTPFDSLAKYDFDLLGYENPIEVNWNVEDYNGLVPGYYQISGKPKALNINRFLEETIQMNVLVENKPLPLDIKLDQNILPEEVVKDQVLANLSTSDEVDSIHSYLLMDNEFVYLNGSQIHWKGEEGRIKAPVNLKVISTDRANQSIERNLTLMMPDLPINLQVYPNPSTRYTTIRVDFSGDEPVNIKIFDATGRLVLEEESVQSNSYERQIDMEMLSNGMYQVQVQIGQFILTKRLVKQN